MELTNEQLDQVREMAAALLQPEEISILLGIPALERAEFGSICTSDPNDPIYMAYNQGRLQTKYELHRTVVKLAKSGSPAAQPLADSYLLKQKFGK